jgi:diguanylate cyclase (GGDEF)-like protein
MTSGAKRINFFKSIKFKAWLGIFTLTILPLVLFGLYAFDLLGNVSRDILVKGNIQAFQQVKLEVSEFISKFDELTHFLANNDCFVKPDMQENAVKALRQIDQSYEGIEHVVWVDAKGTIKAHSKPDSNPYIKLNSVEEALARSNKQTFSYSPGCFYIKAKITDSPDSDSIISAISFIKLRKTIEGLTFGSNYKYYLVTESGENILDQNDFPRNEIADIMDRPCGAYDLLPESNKGSPKIVISLPILNYGLKIFIFQDAGEVYAVARSLGNRILNFVFLLGIASFILATYFSWTITEPVAVVAEKAIQLSEGENEVRVEFERDDELGFLAKCFNSMSQKIIRKITEISALYKVTNYISSSTTSRKALDLCLEHIIKIFKAKRGSIMLLNNERTALVVESFKLASPDSKDSSQEKVIEKKEEDHFYNLPNDDDDKDSGPVHFELKLGEGIAGKVAASGESILCMDCQTDDRFKDYSGDRSKSPKTLVSVPLSVHNKVIGVVNLSDRSNSLPFTDSDLDLLQAIAKQMALSIDNARLHDLTVINELTDLYVRRFLDIRLDDEIKRSKRFGFPLTVVMFSIDNFAELNGKYGNNACEAALFDLGRLLKKTVRATDIPAEYDTNKFCTILAHTTSEQAKLFADRFLKIASEHLIKRDKMEFHITLSAGICQYCDEKYDYSSLLAKSDELLSKSRKIGNSVSVSDDEDKEQQ